MPLTFPPFWACSMSCFETILFRHSGFPGTASAPGALCPSPFGGGKIQAALHGSEKLKGFPPAGHLAFTLLGAAKYRPPFPQKRKAIFYPRQNGSGPLAPGRMGPLDHGRKRFATRAVHFPLLGAATQAVPNTESKSRLYPRCSSARWACNKACSKMALWSTATPPGSFTRKASCCKSAFL